MEKKLPVEYTVEKMRWSKGQEARSQISLGCENKPSHTSSVPSEESRIKCTYSISIPFIRLKDPDPEYELPFYIFIYKICGRRRRWTSFSSLRLRVPVMKLVWSVSALTSDMHLAWTSQNTGIELQSEIQNQRVYEFGKGQKEEEWNWPGISDHIRCPTILLAWLLLLHCLIIRPQSLWTCCMQPNPPLTIPTDTDWFLHFTTANYQTNTFHFSFFSLFHIPLWANS